MRIGMITNLSAGRGARDSERVLQMVKSHPHIRSVVTDRSTSLREVLDDFSDAEVDLLVVNGGDGTLQRTLTELLSDPVVERPPLIAPLRSGRTNSSARDLGVRKSPVIAMDKIIDLSRNGGVGNHVVRRAVLKATLTDPQGGQERISAGMFCGFGVIDRAIRDTHDRFPEGRAQGAIGGALTAAAIVGNLMLGRRPAILGPDAMQLTLDGEQLADAEYYLAICSTLHTPFLKLRPFWGGGPGAVRMTAIDAQAEHGVGRMLRVLRGKTPAPEGEVPGYISRNVDTFDLRVDCGLTIDGELFDPVPGRRVRIEAQEAISFVRA